MALRPWFAHSIVAGGVAGSLSCVGAGTALAQPGASGQPPVFYSPGAGQRAAWNTASAPLSARAVQNGATITHDYGMDFVTIGQRVGGPGSNQWQGLNNAGYVAGQVENDGGAAGLGRVTQAYRIGRTEVPTASWVDFYNAASYVGATQGVIPFLQLSSGWGAEGSPDYAGPGRRWQVLDPLGGPGPSSRTGHMIPVGDISWRTAAIYCNWLHNDRQMTREAFLSGAYDVNTFGFALDGFSDQISHSPGARFWIPTHDQWIAAAHYDPSRVNPDGTTGGYWQQSITSDTAPIYEQPENGGQANALFNRGGRAFTVALGDYAAVQSPWGLFDTAGGSSEWTEGVIYNSEDPTFAPFGRAHEGSARFNTPLGIDVIGGFGGEWAGFTDPMFGLRLAAAIPTPSGSATLLLCATTIIVRRRR
jgi:formylglycine-generating enzyme required for sulfatase activity